MKKHPAAGPHHLRFTGRSAFIAGGLAFIAGLLSTSAVAHAQGGGGFGTQGQVAITGELEGHLHNGWELRLHPALDYFIVNNVSVGGVIGIQYNSGNPGRTTIDLGVRAGYDLFINNQVTFWPTVGIFYEHFSIGAPVNQSGSSTSLNIFAPFLFHIVPHFFIGGGPDFELPLDGGGSGYGVRTVVGGWF